jgi:hypothetical protein
MTDVMVVILDGTFSPTAVGPLPSRWDAVEPSYGNALGSSQTRSCCR